MLIFQRSIDQKVELAKLDVQIEYKRKLLDAMCTKEVIELKAEKEHINKSWDSDVRMFRETIKTLEGVIKTFQEYETHCPAPQVTRKTGIQVDSNN